MDKLDKYLISYEWIDKQIDRQFKDTLIASMAYSTWKSRPSGENVLTPWSYSERVRNIF